MSPTFRAEDPAHTAALDLLDGLLARALALGADSADAVMFDSVSLGVSWRLGKPEDLERSESQDLGLRVLMGKRQAFVSSGDTTGPALEELTERAIAMARVAPEDPYCGLADPALLAGDAPDLDLIDPTPEPDAERLMAIAREAEEAALAVEGVSNSEGASAGWASGMVALATSTGFRGAYSSTSHSISASVLAGEGTAMERDYEFSSARHAEDLDNAAWVGETAGRRAVSRLKPRKAGTARVPVIFAPRAGNSLLGHFAGAINGAAVARGTSFLKDCLEKPVFAAGISVIDDPHRRRGLRSKPFDGEGVANRRLALVDDGRLTTWLLESASARQLGMTSTGHAARGTTSPPSPGTSNLYMEAGEVTAEELIADIASGFYVTELIGFGVNGVTGDYSRGAAGFWIENGELAYPVSEITIAGNLKDMFMNMMPANDLRFRYGTNVPTLRVEGLTVAGA